MPGIARHFYFCLLKLFELVTLSNVYNSFSTLWAEHMHHLNFKSKHTRSLLIALLITFSPTAAADMLGVYAGAGSWKHSSTGKMNHIGTDADMENEYGFQDDYSNFVYVAFEHPFPLVPNIRISRYGLETSGTRTVTATTEFTFAGTAYTNGTDILSEFRWDEEDALIYYEILDNIVSVDFGLGMKKVDAEIAVTAGGVTNKHQISETLPIFYTMFGVMIPGTGISASVDTTQSFGKDSDIVQTNTKVSYMTSYMLGIEAGYRTSKMSLVNFDTVTGEIDFTGPFANVYFHF